MSDVYVKDVALHVSAARFCELVFLTAPLSNKGLIITRTGQRKALETGGWVACVKDANDATFELLRFKKVQEDVMHLADPACCFSGLPPLYRLIGQVVPTDIVSHHYMSDASKARVRKGLRSIGVGEPAPVEEFSEKKASSKLMPKKPVIVGWGSW